MGAGRRPGGKLAGVFGCGDQEMFGAYVVVA
jgi:hypothetical protein